MQVKVIKLPKPNSQEIGKVVATCTSYNNALMIANSLTTTEADTYIVAEK